jgi:hypothetical protein
MTTTSGQVFQASGEMVGTQDGENIQGVWRQAEVNAQENAFSLMHQHYRENQVAQLMATQPVPQLPIASQTAGSARSNPITERQIRYIATTAQYNQKTMQDADKIAQQLFGCTVQQLNTKQVNPIIDKLKQK